MSALKIRYVMFWFKTNKGTNVKRVFKTRLSRGEIKDCFETWSDHIYNNGPYSESHIDSGFRVLKMPKRTVLLKQHDAAWKLKVRIDERCTVLGAMLNPSDL